MASQKVSSKYGASAPFPAANLASATPSSSSNGLVMPNIKHSLQKTVFDYMTQSPVKAASVASKKKHSDDESEAEEVNDTAELENDGERESDIEGHEEIVDLSVKKSKGFTTDDAEDRDCDSDEIIESENEEDRNFIVDEPSDVEDEEEEAKRMERIDEKLRAREEREWTDKALDMPLRATIRRLVANRNSGMHAENQTDSESSPESDSDKENRAPLRDSELGVKRAPPKTEKKQVQVSKVVTEKPVKKLSNNAIPDIKDIKGIPVGKFKAARRVWTITHIPKAVENPDTNAVPIAETEDGDVIDVNNEEFVPDFCVTAVSDDGVFGWFAMADDCRPIYISDALGREIHRHESKEGKEQRSEMFIDNGKENVIANKRLIYHPVVIKTRQRRPQSAKRKEKETEASGSDSDSDSDVAYSDKSGSSSSSDSGSESETESEPKKSSKSKPKAKPETKKRSARSKSPKASPVKKSKPEPVAHKWMAEMKECCDSLQQISIRFVRDADPSMLNKLLEPLINDFRNAVRSTAGIQGDSNRQKKIYDYLKANNKDRTLSVVAFGILNNPDLLRMFAAANEAIRNDTIKRR